MFSVAIGCVHQTRDMFLLFHTRYGSILLQLFVSVRKVMAELHGSYFMCESLRRHAGVQHASDKMRSAGLVFAGRQTSIRVCRSCTWSLIATTQESESHAHVRTN